ncbi:aminotransferase class I/II-fold pyridoxal phosphate-dependent enzyme [Psychrobacter sp. I-STPA10]|uniref:aminotransferase class I/II-fold pyridoxal phosphate-dependent enzyme n=1 Tax=Psychrobacter sp. I-STPA10 TaxID=2585769 RepID=UPI001E412F61|nr:aminotransferase class I/II-fold pyridoxal phosphate-dependent enzyme [Psychrobacter sp. I-STPA10]
MDTLKPKGDSVVKIVSSIERLIRLGHWQAGHKLPTVRSLSDELNVNPSTVSTAYKQLRDAGVIVTKGRQGTFVTEEVDIQHTEMAVPKGLIDLASGNVDGRLLPKLNPDWLLNYNLYSGYEELGDNEQLKQLAKKQMNKHCDINAEPVLFSSTLDIMERALSQWCVAGAKILVEDPCWSPIKALAVSMRLDIIAMPIDEQGAVIPDDEVLASASAMIVTPRAHNPTGVNYSQQRWQTLAERIADKDILLLIDDYWGELSRQPAPNLKLIKNEWIYSTSLSKFLGPDFRIAMAVGNGATIKAMKNRFSLGPRWVSGLLQFLAVNAWQDMLETGLLNKAIDSYAQRREKLINELVKFGFDIWQSGEGLHVWLPVANENYAIQALAAKGWAVQQGSAFSLDKKPAIRISISNLTLEDCTLLAKDIASILTNSKSMLY